MILIGLLGTLAIAKPTTLIPFESEWVVWVNPDMPPQWPINSQKIKTATAAFPYTDAVGEDRNIDIRCLPDCADGFTHPEMWLNGLKAPFMGVNSEYLSEITATRQQQYRKHLKYDTPYIPSTVFIFDSPGPLVPEQGLKQIYLFNEFEVEEPEKIQGINILSDINNGAIYYLNGTEVARTHISPGGERHNAYAKISTALYEKDLRIEGLTHQRNVLRNIDPKTLRAGKNTLSVVVKKSPLGGLPSLYFDAMLEVYTDFYFVKKPYAQNLQSDGFMVSWETSSSCLGAVEIQSPHSRQTLVYSGRGTTLLHHLPISGLASATDLKYRVRCISKRGIPIFTDWYSLKTAPETREDFSFFLYGDSRSGEDKHQKIIELIRAAHIQDPGRFIVHTGDMVTNGYEEWRWQEKFFRPIGDLFASLPILPTLGNHELNQVQYFNYFQMETPHSYYARRYGDVEFFSINSNIDYAPESPQYKWLQTALAESTALWKIAFLHHPPYSCAKQRKPGDLKVREHLVPLFERSAVSLVLLGHDHLYGKTRDINGVRYITSGGGGSWLYNGQSDRDNVLCTKAYHFVQFWVSETSIRWTATDINGAILDRDLVYRVHADEQPTMPQE